MINPLVQDFKSCYKSRFGIPKLSKIPWFVSIIKRFLDRDKVYEYIEEMNNENKINNKQQVNLQNINETNKINRKFY